MGDKVVEIQNQIRNNATNIRDYMSDLSSWEAEMNSLDASLSSKTYPLSEPPPVRSSTTTDESKSSQDTVLKRDKTKMKDYYKAWDNFDIDSELTKLEEPGPLFQLPKVPANPQTKMLVKGGRAVNSEIDRLKDQGNLEFASKDYCKALEKYQECLVKEVPNDIKIILHSNSAECYLRLKSAEQALEQAEKALRIDAKHVKSLLRRAKAKKMLGKFRNARSDLDECLVLDPNNAAVKLEKVKLEKKRVALLEEAKAKMANKARPSPDGMVSVPVAEVNAPKIEEKKEEVVARENKEQVSKAIESISVDMLSVPKNIVEFERNWVMLGDVKKLKSYLGTIDIEYVNAIFQKGNIESDFIMRIVNTFLQHFTEFQEIALGYMNAIVSLKKIAILAKFLTKKEKENIQELLRLLGNPAGFEVFN